MWLKCLMSVHAAALVMLSDAYAQDPMGGSHGLSDFAETNLLSPLAVRLQAYRVLNFLDDQPAELGSCIEGFLTFAGRPLVNVHDVAVLPGCRGRGVAEKVLALAQAVAEDRGACKLTLTLLSDSAGAARLYERIDFAAYQLDPAMWQARFTQKLLN